ncbi:MAG: peptidoglycan binding domain-containing protein [Herbinix sp.]|nr:peptidoglycan binding domain-containing protein [Herbinix sp.]
MKNINIKSISMNSISIKNISIKKLFKSEIIEKIIILTASLILIYLLGSLYFANHFYFNTVINGVNLSLKAHKDAEHIIKSYIKSYELQLIEKDGQIEIITRQNIGMQYNQNNSIKNIYNIQNSFKWISSFFKSQKYYVNDLYVYNKDYLRDKINELDCLNRDIIEPKNVEFRYSNGYYEMIKEINGNKIIKDKLLAAIKINIVKGIKRLDLDDKLCYENPKYTLKTDKSLKTMKLLNKYVSTKIIYKFGSEIELLDGNIINEWLIVDENLEVVISKTAVVKYVKGLRKKYDTVGITRKFKTSTGKIVEVKGGLYGWKINQDAETKALLENINRGEVIEKEPIYAQKALYRDKNDIGNTYVEINITRQYLWFYKEGKLITQGFVVTGNPNKGNATVVGTYMLNYKRKGETLSGRGYEVKVSYWMPFYGNIGLHDASWRSSFGGEIYKRRGTHGCVNAPLYLAKIVFENIEEGIPIISYEE